MVSSLAVAAWTHDKLDQMRTRGDSPADRAVAAWVRDKQDRRVSQLAQGLMASEQPPELDLLVTLLEGGPEALEIDPRLLAPRCACSQREIAGAESLFEQHGLKVLMILVFYSLPSAYAAHKGVRVLHSNHGGTGFLVADLNRRLIETTQFIIDVMTPGGLAIALDQPPTGQPSAVRAALRVRMLHATVRSMIEAHRDPRWNGPEFGKPVNQEDMAGSLLTFSWLVVDGLRRLRLRASAEQEEQYLAVWRKVGVLLGVDSSLIPQTSAEADALMNIIRARQIDAPIAAGEPNTFGIEMTASLIEFLRRALPFGLRFRRLPASVMRFFLPRTPYDVATSLGIPRTYGLDELVRLWFYFEAAFTGFRVFNALNRLIYKQWGARDPRVPPSLLQLSRFFNKRLVRCMQKVDRNVALDAGHREKNIVLHDWADRWKFDQADCMTRGVRLVRRRVAGTK